MKYNLIVADCPWAFSDRLTINKVKRGAASNYKTMSDEDIINLDVPSITAKNAVLALWVPSSKLDVGLKCVERWGFKHKQIIVWCKSIKEPIINFQQRYIKAFRKFEKEMGYDGLHALGALMAWKQANMSLQDVLAFGMGRIARNCHELVLIGTRGKISKYVKNKSQRTVFFAPNEGHSKKPEALQDMLDLIFHSKRLKRLEMFARRDRPGYTCVGLECPSSKGQDIRESIKRLAKS